MLWIRIQSPRSLETSDGGYGRRPAQRRRLTHVLRPVVLSGAACTETRILQKQLTVADRVLHAAMAPSPQTLGVLTKEACKTWEDHLWARVSVLCDEKLSEDMRLLGDNFWERGTKAFDASSFPEDSDSESAALDEMRRVLGKMSELNVEEGSIFFFFFAQSLNLMTMVAVLGQVIRSMLPSCE